MATYFDDAHFIFIFFLPLSMNCFKPFTLYKFLQSAVYLSHWFYEPSMNKLASFLSFCLFKAAFTVLEMGKEKINEKAQTIKTGQLLPKHLDNCGHVEHRTSFPFHELKVLLLDNTKTFQLMYCIFHKMLVIYKYLFIYLVCGFECIFMHTYYTICF